MFLRILILSLVYSINSYAESSPKERELFTSSLEQTHLIELFSTQSCSSCPPAQRQVSNLKGRKGLWEKFIPVVYHVDYWDYLGWKDPYSDAKYSNRQRRYVKEWDKTTAYTPMFVIDGYERRSRSFKGILSQGRAVGVLKAYNQGENYRVSFDPLTKIKKTYYLNYAVLGDGIATNITAGENSGEVLKHDFLVLKFGVAPMKVESGVFQATVNISKLDLLKAPMKNLVFWITEGASLKPVQAVGGRLAAR